MRRCITTSLYQHFANKDAILAGVAELALQGVRTPDTRNEDWPNWLLRNNVRTRQALPDHPNLIPGVMARGPLGIGAGMLESSAQLLIEQGVAGPDAEASCPQCTVTGPVRPPRPP